jgi:hypothetical protein
VEREGKSIEMLLVIIETRGMCHGALCDSVEDCREPRRPTLQLLENIAQRLGEVQHDLQRAGDRIE